MSDLLVARNCCPGLECFPEKPSWCRTEQVCQGGAKSVNRFDFERSDRLDTALYKNYLYLFILFQNCTVEPWSMLPQ